MVVMTEVILDSSRVSVQCKIEDIVQKSGFVIKMSNNTMCSIESHLGKNVLPIVRSIAMSENIARSVKEEVTHFIHVDSLENCTLPKINTVDVDYRPCLEIKMDPLFSIEKSEYNLPNIYGANSFVSHILPPVEENIISAIVLSKWDDIMGPQTVHVWLQDKDFRKLDKGSMCLSKAVKYVTSHTVNYTGLNSVLAHSCANVVDPVDRNSGMFIVPELDLVSQSLVFQLQDHELKIPYSLSVMVSYLHYNYFLHLHKLCQHWLQRMAARLHVILLKGFSTNSVFETNDQVNEWMLDVCYMVQSLKLFGLALTTQIQTHQVLDHPLLERALTSHLQTFGCTVVMGSSPEDINSLILFLALFLETDELHCSRYVLPSGNCSFHSGLFLQGLLLNGFGCRELCSIELAANPYPVTAVDLTRGLQASAVKQTPLHHLHLARRQQMAHREHRQLCEDVEVEELGHPLHESVLYPVKEGASLVSSLLKDMRCLPSSLWLSHVKLFKQKIKSLAFNLLNLVYWMRNDCEKLGHCRFLAQALDLEEADLLIVLAIAEKFQPGVYAYVMNKSSVPS